MKFRSNKALIMTCSYGLASFLLFTGCKGVSSKEEAVPVAVTGQESIYGAAIPDFREQEPEYYYYSCLKEQEQAVYRNILAILQGFAGETEITGAGKEEAMKIFQYVMDDHPELFYIAGYELVTYKRDGDETVSILPMYTMDERQAEERRLRIEERIDSCLAGLDNGMDDYGKAKFIYEYIIDSTEYVPDSPDNQNICSVFLNGKSVCAGYAKAMQYLMQKMGMEAAVVSGTVSNGERHAWNLVKMNGDYYYMDPTWGDASYRGMGTEDKNLSVGISYDYFGITTRQLSMTHEVDGEIPVPECTAEKDNYYIREGLYFTDIDRKQLVEAFGRADKERHGMVSLHCSDGEVYEAMCRYLLDEEKIFKYLRSSQGAVMFASNDRLHTFSFWIEAA